MTSQYEIRAFVPGDRASFEDLYRAVYGDAWPSKTNFRWTVESSPTEAGAAVAVQGDRIVAAQPYCDLRLHTPWGSRRATLFLDVATHPDHQRRGLFRRVVAAASAAAFDRGASIVMTTPNRLATRRFETMPDWVRLCSLDCLAFPLGSGDRVGGGGLLSLGARLTLSAASLVCRGDSSAAVGPSQSQSTIETPWFPGPDADELWNTAAPRSGIMVARDRRFLRWRFGSDYRLLLLRDPPASVGYAAARIVTRAGLKVGLLLDCVAADDERSGIRLLARTIDWIREQGASAVIGYFRRQSQSWRCARKVGFFCLPSAIAPRDYPVYVSVRPGDECGSALLDASVWHLSLADSDLA